MKTLSEAELEANIALFWQAVDNMPEPRKSAVKDMMEGTVGDGYFLAPASAREDFHECYHGGLLVHSLHVVVNLRKLARALCPDRYPKDVLDFVALFHDLGKAGDGEQALYVPKNSAWHEKQGILFDLNPALPFMTTTDRTFWLLQKHGVELTMEEFAALRLADGQYVEENRPYRMKEPFLGWLLHSADMAATLEEKRALREAGA